MVELLDTVPGRVLAAYAHPDDADVSCGGTLARWSREGAEVHLLQCTSGEKGTPDPAVDPGELRVRRAEETAGAAGFLGISGRHQLDYPDGDLVDTADFRGELVSWIRRLRPQTVLCPDPTAVFFGEDYFNHRDHRILGFAMLDAISPAAALPHYFPDAGPPHQVQVVLLSGTLEPTVWVDIGEVLEAKVAAVSCHQSQFADGPDWAGRAVRRRAEEDGRKAGVGYAEGFRRLRLGA